MFNNLKVGTRLFLMTGFSFLVTIIIAVLGFRTLEQMDATLENLYTETLVPSNHLGQMNGKLNIVNLELHRALVNEGKDVSRHVTRAEALLPEIAQHWKEYLSVGIVEREKAFVDTFDANFIPFRDERIIPFINALKKMTSRPQRLRITVKG